MMTKRTYLDWNATAPLLPAARAAMLRALDVTGNPSSVHGEGRAARRIVEDAREQVAALVGARASEVIFTSGATDANNMVVRAGWATIFAAGLEHDSVLASINHAGARHISLPVAQNGVAGLPVLTAAQNGSENRTRNTTDSATRNGARDAATARPGGTPVPTLATLQLANNETGVMQPVAELCAMARAAGIAVHTDATQAVGRTPVSFSALGVDYLSLSSHKLGGPKGAGALVVRDGAPLAAWPVGGGQERSRRAGTENVAAIAGFGAAAHWALAGLAAYARLATMRDQLEAEVCSRTSNAVVIGAGAPRLANTACLALPGRSAETLVAALDLAGIAVSAGAACSSGKVADSHVLAAMGVARDIARSAIRVSIGPTTTNDDIAAFLAAWSSITRTVARAA